MATGSPRIEVGDWGYCQGRQPCAFTDCWVCPHLDTAFPRGMTVTAVATPGKGSVFARWGPGACRGQGATCTFIAQKPSCINAQFALSADPAAPLNPVPCQADP